ncbi:MAG: hypothetical protein AB1742_03635 [bacterium]
MKKLRLYLETSLFGFYFDDDAVNAEKRKAVRTLFEQIKQGMMEGFVSGLVIGEPGKSPPAMLENFMGIIKDSGIREYESDEDEAEALAEKYLSEEVVPASVGNDAVHVALATVGSST